MLIKQQRGLIYQMIKNLKFKYNMKNKSIIIFLIYITGIIIYLSLKKDLSSSESYFNFLGIKELILIFLSNLFTVTIAYCITPIGGGIVLPYILISNIVNYIRKSDFNNFIDILTLIPHGIFELIVVYILFERNIAFFTDVYLNRKNFKRFFNERCLKLYKKEFPILIIKIVVLLLIGAIVETYISNRVYYLFYKGII